MSDTAGPDPTQVKAEMIQKLRKGLRRKTISPKHLERVQAFLKEEYDRFRTDPKAFPTNDWYRERVSGLSDGDLECDNDAVVSRSDEHGAYVQTWSWVPGPGCSVCGEPLTKPDTGLCDVCRVDADEGPE